MRLGSHRKFPIVFLSKPPLQSYVQEAPYDVEVAGYVAIQARIDAPKATAVVVEGTEGLRRSARNSSK
jgi:hypothetical protein